MNVPTSTHVLLVDDDPRVTDGLRRVLTAAGFRTSIAHSAQEALRLLERQPADVIVSDERMPEMSGSQLLAVVRGKYPDTVRVILSGQASLEDAVHAINDGEIYRYLLKPVGATELVLTMRQAAEHRRTVVLTRQLLGRYRAARSLAERQALALAELERSTPGITAVRTDEDGAVVVDAAATGELADILAEIEREVRD